MIEIIKHTLGLCGEGHPSLLCLGLTPLLLAGKTYIKTGFMFIKLGLIQIYKYLRCI